MAEALAIEEQVRAYGGPRLRVTEHVLDRLAQAIERAGVDVVPRVVMNAAPLGDGAGKGGGSGSLLESLVALALSSKLEDSAPVTAPRRARAQALADELQTRLETPAG